MSTKVYEFTIIDDQGLPLKEINKLVDKIIKQQAQYEEWDFDVYWTGTLPEKEPWNEYKFKVFKKEL